MAFRPMRRKAQALTQEAALEILKAGSTGVLSVLGDDGYPYGVPVNYVLDGDTLYFHCARTGHKLDAIQKEPKVSLSVVMEDTVVPETLSTDYKSVIVFGKAAVVEDDDLRRRALTLLCERFAPAFPQKGADAIQNEWAAVCVVGICIEHVSGKVSLSVLKRERA